MNYPMYGTNQFYMQDLQNIRDKIDNQMRQMQLQQNQFQSQQPTPITQNFQLAPTQNNSELDGKYAENIDEVKNTLTLKNTIFVNKDMNMLWFKNAGGEVKRYSLLEIVELDPKDKEIAELKQQIASMQNLLVNTNESKKNNNKKGGVTNDTNVGNADEHAKK